MTKFGNKPVWECEECGTVHSKRPYYSMPGRKRHPTVCTLCGSPDVVGFGSGKEYARFCDLRLLEKAGDISGLQCHPKWDLHVNGQLIGKYTADSIYHDERINPMERRWVVEDVKGREATKTEAYGLRKKLMKAIHGIDVREV